MRKEWSFLGKLLGMLGCWTWGLRAHSLLGKRGSQQKKIRERLDRGVVTENWLSRFPNAMIRHLIFFTLDDCPLLLTLDIGVRQRGNRYFKF